MDSKNLMRGVQRSDRPDESVRGLAAETIEEILIFGCSEDSYGYVFHVCRRPNIRFNRIALGKLSLPVKRMVEQREMKY